MTYRLSYTFASGKRAHCIFDTLAEAAPYANAFAAEGSYSHVTITSEDAVEVASDPAFHRGRLFQSDISLETPFLIRSGSWWKHRNGNDYMVLSMANSADTERYPRTVVYRGENGLVWARRADDWHRSMTPIPQQETGDEDA